MVKWFKISSTLLLLWGYTASVSTQKIEFGGYISTLYMPMTNMNQATWTHNGLIHNRLNLNYSFTKEWRFQLEMRNRAIYGAAATANDDGWMNLSWNWASGKNLLFNSSIDRLNMTYNTDQWSVGVGRQRINWSQTLMFNPNDIFNGYSLFDFDYMERSGSDAVRISYFPTEISIMEVAAKLDNHQRLTAAFLHRFNVNHYDCQYIAGVVNSQTIIVGGGFSGQLLGTNLRGEISYYLNTKTKKTAIVGVIGADYMFSNSLMLSGELLYNSPYQHTDYSTASLYTTQFAPEHLSITPWTLSASLSYAFSPILNAAFTAISYVNIPLFYVGPSLNYSLTDNLTLTSMIQLFAANKTFEPSNIGVGYLRVKYNF